MLKITIITVCYNEKERLRKTIESVCQQTYPDIEYLIIDGDSTDGTKEVIQEYQKYCNLCFYSEKDYGIYNAMNRGIARASGDYIYFINAGDIFFDCHVISDVVSYIGEERETIYYGRVCKNYSDGLSQIEDFSKCDLNLEELLFDGAMPCHQSIFAPKSALTDHYFREQYKIRADYEWLLYSIIHGYSYKEISTIICFYDMSGVSVRLKNLKLFKSEECKILKEYEYILSQKELVYHQNNIENIKTEILKYICMFRLMNYWMILKRKNLNLGKLLKQKGYGHVAIYGISHMGLSLLEELKDETIKIDYAIDRNIDSFYSGLKIVSPEEELDKVDAIIVTALDSFYEIKQILEKKVNYPVLSLEDLLYEMGNMN